MYRLKILGLLALAAMATVALLGASSASAAKFTAGKAGANTIETTLKKYVFSLTGSQIECKKYSVIGATPGTEFESVTGNLINVSECTAFGFAATYTNNGCEFTVNANGESKILGEKCELIMSVSNVFTKCKARATAQNVTKAGSITNGSGDVKVTANHNTVVAEVTESTGACPLTVGKHTNGALTGESTVQAEGTTAAWDE